jgi:ribose-phosphate pyrophosphokinase
MGRPEISLRRIRHSVFGSIGRRESLKSQEVEKSNFLLFTGNSNRELASSVAALLQAEIPMPVHRFSDGELHIQLPSTIDRNKIVFIIQSTCPPCTDQYLSELKLMLDAVRRSSGPGAYTVAVVPYFGYARQDKKDRPREPISAAVIAKEIQSAGAERIIAIDMHSDAPASSVEIPFDYLYATYIILPQLKKEGICGKNLCVFSPDSGGVKRARLYKSELGGNSFYHIMKERDVSTENRSKAVCLFGDVRNPRDTIKGKDVLIIDDMFDTCGTIINAACLAQSEGANQVYAVATHGVFSGKGPNNILMSLEQGLINKIYVTDTIPLPESLRGNPNIVVISVAPLIAKAIQLTSLGKPLGETLIY